MKAPYDHRRDTLSVILRLGMPVAESDEVLDASKRVTDADRMEFHAAT